jgi:arabinogalactan oligomer/maltooligosaccharide transport system permease protein
MLFTGPSRCGKTTAARIIALGLNCESVKKSTDTPCLECNSCRRIMAQKSLDVMEINVGEDSGKAAVAKLTADLMFAPFECRYKVLIFDEAHKLSTAAQDLLLKKVEDGFKHVYFIFCTNKPKKLEDTFISRASVGKMQFGRMAGPNMAELLINICEYEGASFEVPIISVLVSVTAVVAPPSQVPLFVIILAFVVVIPIIYTIGTSLSPNSGILNTIWPDNPSLINYKFLFTGSRMVGGIEETTDFVKWYWNTLQVALLTMVFAVLFVTGTAYVFARYKFKGKKGGLLTILVLQMFPSFLSLIALFTLFQTFGLTNEPKALVIIYVSGSKPFNIWLIKGYLQNIPKELDESAKIDGANKVQIFFKIILPLSVPIISFVAVTQFMAPWMDYILPSYLIIDSDKWTLAVGIFDFINDVANTNYPAFAAAALIVAAPITFLYVVFQKYLIEGITAGANKG